MPASLAGAAGAAQLCSAAGSGGACRDRSAWLGPVLRTAASAGWVSIRVPTGVHVGLFPLQAPPPRGRRGARARAAAAGREGAACCCPCS
jgi:hypothetical protein